MDYSKVTERKAEVKEAQICGFLSGRRILRSTKSYHTCNTVLTFECQLWWQKRHHRVNL